LNDSTPFALCPDIDLVFVVVVVLLVAHYQCARL
jgi:hypothetical protein